MYLFLFRIFIFYFLFCVTIVHGCLKTIPPEEYYPTSTLPVVDMCDMCKIDDIEPDLQAGQFFDSTPLAPTGKCISTNVRCFQQGGLICTSSTISSVTASGSTVIATMDGNLVEARLDCEKDGMFSSGTATKITQLACEFTGCVTPCEACDISTLTPASLPTGAVFEAVDQGSGGCQLVRVTCKRDDTITTCDSVSIIATIPSGTLQIGTISNYDSVSVNLECATDRLYTFGAQSGISALTCDYVNCYSCKSCDIAAITPASMPAGTTMEFEDRMPGACKRTLITCKRTDGGTCDSITVQAITAGGTSVITSASMDVSEATGGINCNDDGFYTDGANRITSLNCVFDGCNIPCSTCDITPIQPTGLMTGQVFESSDSTNAGGCKETLASCTRDDGFICDSIELLGNGGIVIETATNAGIATATLTCGSDATYSGGTLTQITSLTCVYNGCQAACAKCDITPIQPTGLMAGQVFESSDSTNAAGCTVTEASCKRDDDQICDSIELRGDGGVVIASSTNAAIATGTLTCGGDGTYSGGTLTRITSLTCVYNNCKRPCERCNINSVAPTGLGTRQEFSADETVVSGQCRDARIYCTRTDGLVCNINIDIQGMRTIARVTQEGQVDTTIVCGNTGMYETLTGQPITQILCVFFSCM